MSAGWPRSAAFEAVTQLSRLYPICSSSAGGEMNIVDPPSSRNNQTTEALRPDVKPKLVVIAGPTAVGKTFAGIELALRFDGEVINADSRYLYRGLDIGVAKPNLIERRGL